MSKLIIDGNAVYEIDEQCMKKKEQQKQPEQQRKASVGMKTVNKRNSK